MKKIIYTIALVITASCFLCSCDDFLDINPEDRMTSEQIYSSEGGINSAWNGVYMYISQPGLYGTNMTMTAMDVLGQRYNMVDSRKSYFNLANYKYTEKNVKELFDEIWTSAYVGILQTNDFLRKLENTEGLISTEKKDILLGEAYGLRAFLHFDMLRLFGPRYSTIDSSSRSIPYYSKANAVATDLLPANQVMDSIMTDLDKAEQLLLNDPIISSGVMNTETNDPMADFYRFRNKRFNYYAVKALQARVFLYRGNKAAALAAAKTFTREPGANPVAGFAWTNYLNITSAANPDRVFSSEIIFGLRNQNMYTNQDDYFSGALTEISIVAPVSQRLDAVYESFRDNDYRYTSHWKIPTDGGKTHRTFFKYARPQDFTMSTHFSYFQPLLRLSEMYLIAAECEPIKEKAIQYLNTLRYYRGLANLAATANVTTEVTKEYQKEFFGEGQLFFYYKRTNATSIPRGSAASGNFTGVGTAIYVVPLPESETSLR